MRVDILANEKASYLQPMAEGLVRMLRGVGAEPRLHSDGLEHLMRALSIDFSSPRSFVGSSTKLIGNRGEFSAFVDRLRGSDVIVIVSAVPGAFSPSLFPNIEVLRKLLPDTPIVNYDLHYLPMLYSWSKLILRNEETMLAPEHLQLFRKGKFGLERYDWYLMVSVGSHTVLPPGEHPYSLIGMNLDDGSLYPEQNGEFMALLDFDVGELHYPQMRQVQLEAVKRAGVKCQRLEGRYPRSGIRAIYRKAGAFLMSRSEAFGLPISEVQACGSLVFLPDPHWAAAHWLGDNFYIKREPALTSNFVVYENDAESLASRLRSAAENFNPAEVRQTFIREQPQLYYGDGDELRHFLDRVENGEIHSRLHSEHYPIGRAG
jgi:glycosyltransferase involved in cell wall biosynthesis